MPEIRQFDVTIVGSGIAGSALATSLSGQGLAIALVEAHPLPDKPVEPPAEINGFDARVSALTPRSQALLEHVGAWAGIAAQRLCPYSHMTVWDGDGTAVIEFDCAEVEAPLLGHIVENRVVVSALLARVRECRDIDLLNPARLADVHRQDNGSMVLELESGERLETRLLVAADGALSPIRAMLDFKTREWDYGHRAIVTTVQVESPHQATAWQRFLPTGPLAFLPLPDLDDRHYCSIVWSVDEELVDGLLDLEDAAFCAELEQAFESRLGKVQACAARFAFPLRQRHAVDYVQPGVALVGDAAHTIHPLAGQGINLGLQDVTALSEEILAASVSGANPGDLVTLRRYQRRRKGENLAMMTAMDGFKRLFADRSPAVRWLRNAGMRGVGRFAPVKQELMRHAMGIVR